MSNFRQQQQDELIIKDEELGVVVVVGGDMEETGKCWGWGVCTVTTVTQSRPCFCGQSPHDVSIFRKTTNDRPVQTQRDHANSFKLEFKGGGRFSPLGCNPDSAVKPNPYITVEVVTEGDSTQKILAHAALTCDPERLVAPIHSFPPSCQPLYVLLSSIPSFPLWGSSLAQMEFV
ncbi:unnamed protein product [Pleuronectes platessa]|uniref:Uncharacterized protein n=1 Tax=Pleuronectes platessa TaxID=8262 RepID=A0A9N7Y8Z1_PLEPL|nr:unnamed protein product [Pleuronectes platessa]